MKKYLFIIVALLAASCSKNELIFTETGSLEVNCYDVEVSPMNTQRRASSTSITSMSKIVYIVLDDNEKVACVSEQNKGDENFGYWSANIAVGDYTLLIYTSAVDNPVVVNNDGTITITKCGNAYSASTSFSIERNKRTSVTAELSRCVAKINFSSVENIPSEISKCQIIVTGNSSVYDITQSRGVNTTSYDSNQLSISSCTLNDNKFGASVYVLLPDEETTISLTFNFYSNTNTLLYSRTFNDVPVKINHQTNFSAAMFHEHGADGSNITIDTTWGTAINIDM